MTYQPETTQATCAWCGQPIDFEVSPDGVAWVDDTDGDCCYDDNLHVPDFDIVVSRAGAANYTADELAALFILDVAQMRPAEAYASNQRDDIEFALTITGWCDDPDDSQALSDLIPKWEGIAADAGYGVTWDDGYQIWRIAQ